MPKQMIRKLLVCTCFAALGGCQFLGSLHLTHRSQAAAENDPQLAAASQTYIQAGRDHLRAGRPGLAIDAFNLALSGGEDPAAAYNGLGVAYARIGRSDLAFRFFRKAVNSDPQNPVYVRNLATLVDSPAFTLDQMKRAEPTQQVAVATQPAPAAATSTPRVAGRLYRDSNRQFSLTTQGSVEGSAVNGTQTAALPTMHSRNAAPTQVAVNAPAPSSLAPTSAAAAPAEPAVPAIKGKRKTVQMIGTPQGAPRDQGQPETPSAKPAST